MDKDLILTNDEFMILFGVISLHTDKIVTYKNAKGKYDKTKKEQIVKFTYAELTEIKNILAGIGNVEFIIGKVLLAKIDMCYDMLKIDMDWDAKRTTIEQQYKTKIMELKKKYPNFM